jgi:hypothetical protein
MKKIVLIFTAIIFLCNLSFSQQASKTLDFIQTKDGRKLYGKITEMDPKVGISIQTYGDGNIIKLKHEEIEFVKMASTVVEVNEKSDSSRWMYKNSFSVCYVNPYNYYSPVTPDLFNETNNFSFNRIGFHFEPTLVAKGRFCLGLIVGYEKGRKFSSVPIGLTMKLGKKINNRNAVYVNLMAGWLIASSKIDEYTQIGGTYYAKQTIRHLGVFAGIGLGVMHTISKNNNKLFIDVNYRFEGYEVPYLISYNHNSANDFITSMWISSDNLQIRAGIMF